MNVRKVPAYLLLSTIILVSCDNKSKIDISWNSTDGTQLEGTLLLPKGSAKSTVVLIHGSGTIDRSLFWYKHQAEKLRDLGLAVFYYDKRGTGNSGGDWTKVGFDQLADDAVSVISRIKDVPQLANTKIGFIGYSQGGWIMLKAREKYPQTSFLVSVSGSTQTPAKQGNYVSSNSLRQSGYDEKIVALADSINDVINQVYLTDSGWENATALIQTYSNESWAKQSIGMVPRDSWRWKWYANLPIDYNPRPALETLNIPLLALHGGRDPLCDGQLNASYLDTLKEKVNITNYTDAQAPHILRYKKKHMLFWERSYWKPDYYETIQKWMKSQNLL